MTTNDTGRFGGILPRFIGRRTLHTFAGGLALFLAAVVPVYGQTAKESVKTSGKTVAAKAGKTEKSAAGATEYKQGLAAFEKGKYKDAVPLFLAAAEKGNSDAMIMLSYCLSEGIGTDEDEDEAMKWLKKSADAGNAYGQAMYGDKLMEEDEAEEAIRYFNKSAKQGCLLGLFFQGMYYLQGDDMEKGLEILLKIAGMPLTNEKTIMDYAVDRAILSHFENKKISSSNAIISMAQFLVGLAYAKGEHFEKDLEEGIKWIRKAAKNEMKDALEMLEGMEDEEDEDEEDEEDEEKVKPAPKNAGTADLKKGLAAFDDEEYEDAVEYFEAAAKKGNSDAMLLLGFCLHDGIGVEKDIEDSLFWLKKSADAGNANGQAVYAVYAVEEDDDEEEAVKYLKKSVKQGCILGKLVLGQIYMSDEDTVKEGFQLVLQVARMPMKKEKSILDYVVKNELSEFDGKIETASDALICMAQYMVGKAYLEGNGVKEDPDEAKKWFRKAAKNGLTDAQEILEDLEDEEEVDEPVSKNAGVTEYRKGVAAVADEEFEDAAKYFLAGAKKGNPEAMAMYGVCLYDGTGVDKNRTEGMKWFKKGADTGNANAQALYGTMLLSVSGEVENAIKYLKKSADRGCIFGQFGLIGAYGHNAEKMTPSEAKEVKKYLKLLADRSLSSQKDFFDDFEALSPMIEDIQSGAKMEVELPKGRQTVSNTLIVMGQALYGIACTGDHDLDEARKWIRKAKANGLVNADDLLRAVNSLEK